jgi:hypothetical protein
VIYIYYSLRLYYYYYYYYNWTPGKKSNFLRVNYQLCINILIIEEIVVLSLIPHFHLLKYYYYHYHYIYTAVRVVFCLSMSVFLTTLNPVGELAV